MATTTTTITTSTNTIIDRRPDVRSASGRRPFQGEVKATMIGPQTASNTFEMA
jgi:hypothetical protein